ncbi:glycosyltransferase family 2 protein, partial [Peptostreptococcus anaerobius]|uniref:glycosyltransferase family 2 protein n=1 Tax=Peptostreptococcus anaerobius TaxID=1261 RepID=UPI0034A25550
MFTSVIIPAYNESERIIKTLDGIANIEEINEIVVVDDGSSDDTAELLRNYKLDKLIFKEQPTNQGKGKALERGLETISPNAEVVVFLDGDVMETSSEVFKIIRPVVDGECDVAIARFRPAKKKGGMGFVK